MYLSRLCSISRGVAEQILGGYKGGYLNRLWGEYQGRYLSRLWGEYQGGDLSRLWDLRVALQGDTGCQD